MPRKTEQHMIAIEPATMTVPTMDRPSIAFAWFLDSIRVEKMDESEEHLIIECTLCGESICEIKDGQSLRVILNTALAHGC